jgi:hypothetical protein
VDYRKNIPTLEGIINWIMEKFHNVNFVLFKFLFESLNRVVISGTMRRAWH